MCGIWAKTKYGAKVESADLTKPASLLKHRGPDGWAWWSDEQALLMQTRLSIIDLAGGTQPLISYDQKWVGVVNGELYDFESHREALQKDGVRFQTGSDSEVLLNLYARHGIRGLQNLSGEFAFVFYHRERKALHFGRDLSGVKPLFLRRDEDQFLLSSEMKAIADEDFSFNPTYLKNYLMHGLVPPQTSILGIEHVWPGQVHVLDLATRLLQSESFEALPLRQDRELAKDQAVDALEAALNTAVKRRLRADVDVGCYLSGGVDSALVAAIASRHSEKIKAFTVGFTDAQFDESKLAADIARDLGLSHSIVEMNAKNFMRSLKKSIVAFENPVSNPHGAAKNLLAQHASQEVKVVLSGEGADEWFGGYAYFRIQKLRDFAQAHPIVGKSGVSNFLLKEGASNLNHLDGHSTRFDELAKNYFDGKMPSLLGRLSGSASFSTIEKLLSDLESAFYSEMGRAEISAWDLNTWIALRSDLLQYILANVGDRQEMSHSIEGRTPFLDLDVLKLAGRIHPHSLIRGLNEKHVLRQVAKRYLKPAQANRAKKPFFAPTTYLFSRTNKAEVDYYLEQAKLKTGFLDWNAIESSLKRNHLPRSLVGEDELVFNTLFYFSLGVLATDLTATTEAISLAELSQHRREFA